MRNLKVEKRVQEHYDELVKRGYKVILVALQGSQNYGLDIYTDEYRSDVDTKAIVLPTLKDIVLGAAPVSTTLVLENNEHIDVKDVRAMFKMFEKQNISYLELLYSKYVVFNPEYEELLRALYQEADLISTMNSMAFFKSIKGMAFEKQKALTHPYPNTLTKIEKFGYDPKQLHHILRLQDMLHQLLEDGRDLNEAFEPLNKEALLEIKKGCYSLPEAQYMCDSAVAWIAETCDEAAKGFVGVNSKAVDFLNYLCLELVTKSLKEELQ